MTLASVREREWPRLEQGCMYGWMNGVNMVTWLLRSYLEPGYTEHNHFVVFIIGDKLTLNLIFNFYYF